MHRLVLAAALAALWIPAAASAARVEGKVVNKARPEAVADLEVLLIGLDSAGQRNETTAKTDNQGRFVFESMQGPAGYVAQVRYDGLLHPGGVVEVATNEGTQTLDIQVHERSDQATGIELQGTIVYVEPQDAGVWGFGVVMGVTNSSDRVVITPESAPALRVALPLGHGTPDVNSPLVGPLETTTSQNGFIGIRGPLFPGDQQINVSYLVDAGSGPLDTELVFSDETPRAIVLVEDRNVAISAGELHPAPPVSVQGKAYQQYFGFDLPAGTRVPLRVTMLPDRSVTPRWLTAVSLSLPFAVFALLVLLPIAQARTGRVLVTAHEPAPQQAALIAALADLEHDFEMGKVSAEDRDRLRAELREDTLRELARESEPTPAPASTAVLPKACECGRPVMPGDRFCSQCGRAL